MSSGLWSTNTLLSSPSVASQALSVTIIVQSVGEGTARSLLTQLTDFTGLNQVVTTGSVSSVAGSDVDASDGPVGVEAGILDSALSLVLSVSGQVVDGDRASRVAITVQQAVGESDSTHSGEFSGSHWVVLWVGHVARHGTGLRELSLEGNAGTSCRGGEWSSPLWWFNINFHWSSGLEQGDTVVGEVGVHVLKGAVHIVILVVGQVGNGNGTWNTWSASGLGSVTGHNTGNWGEGTTEQSLATEGGRFVSNSFDFD